jgi:hypothetical protein
LLLLLFFTCCCQIRWLMHYIRGMVAHYMAAVQHVLGNREAQADCYHAQVTGTDSKHLEVSNTSACICFVAHVEPFLIQRLKNSPACDTFTALVHLPQRLLEGIVFCPGKQAAQREPRLDKCMHADSQK